MTWKIFDEELQRWKERQEKLKRVSEIVKTHPEWIEAEPELQQLVAELFNDEQPQQPGK